MGSLYICATPIGNLEDITIRVLNTLKSVDYIAAEDTRVTMKLLNHYDIKSKLISYHEHNKKSAGMKLLDLLEHHDIALVTDAGMPGISDPGEDIIKLCIKHNIKVEVLPGASAFVTGLVGSGLSTRRFLFEGFIDRNKSKRKKRLEELKVLKETLIIYESPHRLKALLSDMLLVFGNREIVIVRELTKKFEEYYRGSIEEAIAYFENVKGEIIVYVEGNSDELVFDKTIEEELMDLMSLGVSKKEAIKEVAKKRSIPKKEVYSIALQLEE